MLLFYVRKHSTVALFWRRKQQNRYQQFSPSLDATNALPSHPLSMGVTSSKPRLVCARVYQRDVRGRNLTQSDLTSASKPLNWSTVRGKPHWGWRSVRQGVGSPFAYQSSLIFNDLNKGLIPFLGKDFEEHLFKRTTVQRNLPRPIDSNRSDEALIKA